MDRAQRRPTRSLADLPARRRVLAIAHNFTAASRLFDVTKLPEPTPRLDIVFTDPES